MKEKRGARRHFAIDMLETLFGSINAFRIGACLAAKTAMLEFFPFDGNP